MMKEQEVWNFLEKHLRFIFSRDFERYKNACVEDLSLYEWFVTKHKNRQTFESCPCA